MLDFLRSLYNAERLLALVHSLLESPLGVLGLAGIVFAETGLLVGFFLPGDSLLFSVGVAAGAAKVNVYLLAVALMAAAIVGDNLGYFLGRSQKTTLLHPRYLQRTKDFYKKYGGRAVIYARFIPIVRTFTPFVSGVAEMPYRSFMLYSLVGGAFWIAFMMTIGYQLGQIPLVQRNFEKAILGVIVISILPAILEVRRYRKSRA